MRCGDFRTTYAADMAIFETPVSRWATLLFLAALAAVPAFATSYWLDVLDRIAIASMPALRLKGLYLAMATLAAHFIVEFTAVHWDAFTGGVNGTSVPAASLGPLS